MKRILSVCASPRALPDAVTCDCGVTVTGGGLVCGNCEALSLPPFPPGPGERVHPCLWGFMESYGSDWLKLGRDVSAAEQKRREAEGWLVRVGSCGAPTGALVPVAFAAAITSPPGVGSPPPGSVSQLTLF